MYKDDFGVNVFECGLEKALGSRRFREAQKMLLNFGPETDNPCVNCQRYKIMKETKSYLTLEEIEEYKSEAVLQIKRIKHTVFVVLGLKISIRNKSAPDYDFIMTGA